jgi:hypothetical protein
VYTVSFFLKEHGEKTLALSHSQKKDGPVRKMEELSRTVGE